MYRAVTLQVLRSGADPGDADAVCRIAASVTVDVKPSDGGLSILLNDEDVTSAIRSVEVTNAVSAVSRLTCVRRTMVNLQRNIGRDGGVVLEGRDIGTVVFPAADLKIFMVADINARAERRRMDLLSAGTAVELDVLKEDIRRRDETDSTREESPLTPAPDAVRLDTSNLSIEEQVDFVVSRASEIAAHEDHDR